MFGLTIEDFGDAAVEVWPDVWESLRAFEAMRTQWRVGATGAYGLDYNALPGVFRFLAIPRKSQPEMFDDLRVMEDAALAEIHKGK